MTASATPVRMLGLAASVTTTVMTRLDVDTRLRSAMEGARGTGGLRVMKRTRLWIVRTAGMLLRRWRLLRMRSR